MELEMARLSDEIKGGRRSKPKGKPFSRLSFDNAWFLYLSNGFIRRGVNQTYNAIFRNGYEIIASSKTDQRKIDEFMLRTRMRQRLKRTAFNTILVGYQCWELYNDKKGVSFDLIPPEETDFQRDSQKLVLFDDSGNPKGYVQKRDGKEIATLDAKVVPHFRFDYLNNADLGISMLQATTQPATEYGFIRKNISDAFIRSLPVMHMVIEDGTPEDIEEVANSLAEQFTAETVYVTSERYSLNPKSAHVNIDIFNYTEPLIADIAACFNMPIELIGGTRYLNTDDFPARYIEWTETIKDLQENIAMVLEYDVFPYLVSKPVKVKFKNPAAISPEALLAQVGFATQSEVIDPKTASKIVESQNII